jgi:hypothetical protein
VYESFNKTIEKLGMTIPIPQHYDINRFMISNGQTDHDITLFDNKTLPSRMFFVFVNTAAISGADELNPFNFLHADLSEYQFTKGSEKYPQYSTRLDFEDDSQNGWMPAYREFLKASGIPQDGHGRLITPANYAGGRTVFGVNFTAQVDEGENVQHIVRPGKLSLRLIFNTAPQNIQMLTFSYYDNDFIQITPNREVTTSWV